MSGEDFKKSLAEFLKDEGLLLVPETLAQISADIYVHQHKLLKKKTITPYLIAKFNLIPGVKTIRTVKTMTEDGRIGKDEFFIDTNGRMKISTSAIKRLRNER